MPRVTLRRIEVFVAIVDEGSFAAAAERLGIAQPGPLLAMQIRMTSSPKRPRTPATALLLDVPRAATVGREVVPG